MPKPTSLMKRSAERQARIVKLAKLGLSDQEISDAMGMSKSQVAKLRRDAGVRLKPYGSLPPEVIAEMRRLHEAEEWPPGEIAIHLGISYETVHRHLGKTVTWREWNKVARWAAKNHPKLWEELRA